MSAIESKLSGLENPLHRFVVLLMIATDTKIEPRHQSSAWFLMGGLTHYEPGLSGPEEDCGVLYFVRAITVDESNLDAWFAIANNYGTFGPFHRDFNLYAKAMRVLCNNEAILLPWMRESLAQQALKYPFE